MQFVSEDREQGKSERQVPGKTQSVSGIGCERQYSTRGQVKAHAKQEINCTLMIS